MMPGAQYIEEPGMSDAEYIQRMEAELARLRTALPKTPDGATVVPGDDVWVWDADHHSAKQCLVHSVDRCGDVFLFFHGVPDGAWAHGTFFHTRGWAEKASRGEKGGPSP